MLDSLVLIEIDSTIVKVNINIESICVTALGQLTRMNVGDSNEIDP